MMRRRRLLATAAASSGALPPDRSDAAARLPVILGPAQARFRFLTDDPSFLDSRPCFSPSGDHVLFRRSPAHDRAVSAFWIVPTTGGVAEPFYVDLGVRATRPDWSWSRSSYEIAFTGIDAGGHQGVYLLDARNRDVVRLPAGDPADVMEYPSWYPDGRSLVLTNYRRGRHQIVRLDLDRRGVLTPLTDPSEVWAGMASVSPSTAAGNPIAFADQRAVGEYDQGANQIWIQKSGEPPYQLDPGEGRAPWWSPDGGRIAFESNREANGQQVYQIFRLDADGGGLAAVTPHALATQHPKWSPSGHAIVFAASFPSGGGGIALVES